MSTQTQSELQNEEMYAIEFCDFELSGYEPEAEDEEIENEYRCPVCESHELQDCNPYPLSADGYTTELYQCAECGAIKKAEECRINPPALEEIENEYRCPVCESHELQYCMAYPLSADDATTELYQCGQCGAMGEADDCRINPPALDWRQAGTLPPATPAARKPATTEDDMERARRYGKGDQEVAA
jgi:transcription elongation factor Elf1